MSVCLIKHLAELRAAQWRIIIFLLTITLINDYIAINSKIVVAIGNFSIGGFGEISRNKNFVSFFLSNNKFYECLQYR